MKKIVSAVLTATLVSTFGIVNVQAGLYDNKTIVKPEGERKKAPKRTVETKKNVVKKEDLKYVDKSESSKVHKYDPKTGKRIDEKEKKEVEPKTVGGKKFKALGCVMCHKKDSGRLGPSLPKLAQVYKGKKDELVKYLHRDKDTKPLINSDRAAVMRTQLAKLRILSSEELEDVARHILRGGKD